VITGDLFQPMILKAFPYFGSEVRSARNNSTKVEPVQFQLISHDQCDISENHV